MANIIEIKELYKTYKETKAVNGISLNVEKGELFALLGLNGAGKTTTIKMLTGLIKPTSGDAFVDGHSIVNEIEAVKQITSISPQESAIAKNLTVEQNIIFMARIYGEDKETAIKKTEEVIKQCGLEEVRTRTAKKLSGGYQRRLSIAMAIVSEPEILFLDEPTLGLDVINRRSLWKTIEELKKVMTIILTTHYMEEVQALANHVAIISKGEIKAYGTVDELMKQTDSKTLEDAFIKLSEEAM